MAKHSDLKMHELHKNVIQYRYLGCYRKDKIFRIIIVLLDLDNNILQYEHVTRVNICPFVRL